jgi:hypothetical protein
MSTEITSVSVSGCYWTGSSAVLDLLKEHSSCVIIPDEFSAYSYGQFFEEVLHPLREGIFHKSAIEKNLTRFIEFNKNEPPILFAVIRRFCHLISFYPEQLFYRRMGIGTILGKKYRAACESFVVHLRELEKDIGPVGTEHLLKLLDQILVEGTCGALSNISRAMPEQKLIGVFDQFIAAPYIEFAKPWLPDTKFINVDRDWRDQYVEMRPEMDRMIKVNNSIGARPWAEHITDRLPTKIDFFVGLRKRVELLKARRDKNAQTIWLKFEDLVTDVDRVAVDLFDFLDIDKENWSPGTVFIPTKSATNIGKWRKSPYQDELEIIEFELSRQF